MRAKKERRLHDSITEMLEEGYVNFVEESPSKTQKPITEIKKEETQPTDEAATDNKENEMIQENTSDAEPTKISNGTATSQNTTTKIEEPSAPAAPRLSIYQKNIESVMDYKSMYQPKKYGRKPYTRRTDTTFQTLHKFREKCGTTNPLIRMEARFMVNLLLELEEEFSKYLFERQSRWMNKSGREKVREEMLKVVTEQKVAQYLIFFNAKFSYTEHLNELNDNEKQGAQNNNETEEDSDGESESDDEIVIPKKRRNKNIWGRDNENDSDDKENGDVEASGDERSSKGVNGVNGQENGKKDGGVVKENEFGFKNFYIKRIVLKIWGFYNERFKQAWEDYTKTATTGSSLYLALALLVEIVCKYISRKRAKVIFPICWFLLVFSCLRVRGRSRGIIIRGLGRGVMPRITPRMGGRPSLIGRGWWLLRGIISGLRRE